MSISDTKPFIYNVPWKSSSVHFGDHLGTQRGSGDDYKGNASLLEYPDARRMDLRQTLRDPYEQVQVRTFNQTNTTPVFAVCDVSSSMQFGSTRRKLDKAMQISLSVAHSAYQMGDTCGFIAYGDRVIDELSTAPSHYLAQNLASISNLETFVERHIGSQGIIEVPLFLSQKRSLVFWISDFHMEMSLIEKSLNAMSAHQVIPIVLWDEGEYKALPTFGFGNLIDPESGAERTVFFTKALRQKFVSAFTERREALESLFLKFDYPALFIESDFSPDIITNYFQQYMSV
jgi:uncharacterized protein (DUF58 family)